jgi:MFS family permease
MLQRGRAMSARHDVGMVAFAGGERAPFARYWLSGFLAEFGDGVRLAAFPLLVAQFSHSPSVVAAVTAAQSLPSVLLGGGLGVIADRIDRRRLMVLVDVTRAVVIAALAAAILGHAAGLVLIYLAAFITGTGSALRNTAAVTCVPRLVPPADLDQANGRMVAGQIVGNELAGPAAGGWLFGLAAVLPFALNAGALGIAVLLLLTLPSVFQPPPRPQHPQHPQHPHHPQRRVIPLASLRQDLAEGLRWLWQHPDIRDLTIAVGVIAAVDSAWFAVLVLYVITDLHQQPGAYGLLLAIGALGGVLAGGFSAPLTRRLGPWWSLLVAGLAMAVSQTVLGLASNVFTAAAMLFASSAAFALFNITAITMRQRQVPAALLGRVTGLYGAVASGAETLGAVAGGVLATAAGIRAPMLAGALPVAVATGWLAWKHHRTQPS